MKNLEAVELIQEHRDEVVAMIRKVYKESLAEIDAYDEKVLIYDGHERQIVHWSHQHGMWSQEEQDGDAICIYCVRGSDDGDMDEDAVECFMEDFDADRIVDDILTDLRSRAFGE